MFGILAIHENSVNLPYTLYIDYIIRPNPSYQINQLKVSILKLTFIKVLLNQIEKRFMKLSSAKLNLTY